MNSFETWQVLIGCIQVGILLATFAGALYVGVKANEINDRVRALQDYVGIAALPGDGLVKLVNIGKVNVYLWGFDMPGNIQRFDKGRLIPVGASDSAHYWIGLPDITKIQDKKFNFTLYLKDEFNNEWVTHAGGDMIETKSTDTEKQVLTYFIRVWSYSTERQDWTFESTPAESTQ